MTKDTKQNPVGDLSQLVTRAQDAVRASEVPPAPARTRPRVPAWLAGTVAAGAIVVAYFIAGPWVLGFSDAVLRQGLTSMAEAARKDVEAYRRANGSLPAAIPNIALALGVEYSRTGDDYRLRASDGTRVVEMDSRGTVVVSAAR